jgi:hypothetical protein
VTPEEIDRELVRDATGVRASPRFASAVMAAVRREANAPPPLPFPWTRAAPGIAAIVLSLALTAASLFSMPSGENTAAVPRAVEIAAKIGGAFAGLDARSATIWLIVAALTVVPIVAPLMLVRAERGS